MSAAPALGIFGGLGFAEMLVIVFISILVFGGRLPEVLRNLGQAYARVRRAIHDMSRPIRDEIQRATTLPPAPPPGILPAPAPESVPSYDVGTGDAHAGAGSLFPSPPPTPPAPPPAAPAPAESQPWFDEPPPV
jgi:Sec-independent protein translocase protein TatA